MAPTAPGSQRVAPQPGPKMDLAALTPSPAHGPGLSLARAAVPGVTTAALDPALARIADAHAAGRTAARDAIEVTVAPPCPTAADTSETEQILTQTAAWECLV